MILIGQYDSPFVRRVAVALRIYGFTYEHRPWSTFGDADKLAAYNPLRRVPTLVLDDGETLVDSAAILDCLDERAGPADALIPRGGPQRRAVLRVCALATGLCDKMVSLVYEGVLHETTSRAWIDRCEAQIGGALDLLEVERAGRATGFWFGERLTHGDVAVTCAMRFLAEAHPELHRPARWPALAAHAERCEQMAPFQAITRRFVPPNSRSR